VEDAHCIAPPQLIDQSLRCLLPAVVERNASVEELGLWDDVDAFWVLENVGDDWALLEELFKFLITNFLVDAVFELGETILFVLLVFLVLLLVFFDLESRQTIDGCRLITKVAIGYFL
jgi:hypothetical protein